MLIRFLILFSVILKSLNSGVIRSINQGETSNSNTTIKENAKKPRQLVVQLKAKEYHVEIAPRNSYNSSMDQLARYVANNGTALIELKSPMPKIFLPLKHEATNRPKSLKKFTNEKNKTHVKVKDDNGAQFYIIVVIIFYSFFAFLVLVIRIKPKKKIKKEDKERETAEYLIKGMQDYLVTKKILEQLSNKEYREKAWSIYRSDDIRRDSQFERSLLLKEEHVIKNIEKKIENINKKKSNLKEFEQLQLNKQISVHKRRMTLSEIDFDHSADQPVGKEGENFLKRVSDWKRNSAKIRFSPNLPQIPLKISRGWRQRSLPANKKLPSLTSRLVNISSNSNDHYFSVHSPVTNNNQNNVQRVPLEDIFPQVVEKQKIEERINGRFRIFTIKSDEETHSKKTVSFDDQEEFSKIDYV